MTLYVVVYFAICGAPVGTRDVLARRLHQRGQGHDMGPHRSLIAGVGPKPRSTDRLWAVGVVLDGASFRAPGVVERPASLPVVFHEVFLSGAR